METGEAMTDPIPDAARELAQKTEAHEAVRHICEVCDGDNIAKVCRALIARTEALRELVDANDEWAAPATTLDDHMRAEARYDRAQEAARAALNGDAEK